METIYIIIFFWGTLLSLFMMYVGIQYGIIRRKLETQELQRKLAEAETEEWREKMLDKVKEKIALTEEARDRMTRGEDLVAKYIYHQQGIEELSTELFSIYQKPINTVKKQYPDLTELDLLVICLLGIGMDNVEVCSILRMEKRTLYRRRQLIAQRIGLTSSTALEEFAKNMLQETLPEN
ncbi:MAG: hypothetical protein J6M55_03700 [Paludibacteraceae bacterium]|nr:hypothetical protein [Paludibacteraceae bacterium]